MHPSEIMTIIILFQQSHYRSFKAYYTQYVQRHLRSEFPTLVSYHHFVELMPAMLVPLVAYLHTQLGNCTGISFIDSTPLPSVAIHAFTSTASVMDEPLMSKPQSAGFMAISCTWLLMIKARSWPFA
jgi:hypothetical protein